MLPCNDYVVLDLETTGLDAKKNKIIEIGAVRIRNGRIVNSFSTLVRPGCKLEPRIIQLTGITDEVLEKAPTIKEIIDDFLEFAGNDVLLGHGILFDYSFMKRAVVNHAKVPEFERMGLDTLAISRKYLSELPSRRLGDLCRYFEIAHKPHRALEDAKATHALYQKLLETVFYADCDFTMEMMKAETQSGFEQAEVPRGFKQAEGRSGFEQTEVPRGFKRPEEQSGFEQTEVPRGFKQAEERNGFEETESAKIRSRSERITGYVMQGQTEEELLQQRKQNIIREKENAFTPKPLIYKVKKEAPIMQKQMEWLNRAFQYHGIVPEYDVHLLTKNEASREMDRIIRCYGRM